MTQRRTKDGKFAKKIENPDCEVATVGYVKRLICSTRGHTHQQTTRCVACLCGAVCGWTSVLTLLVMSIAFRTNLIDGLWGIVSFTVAIVCTLISYDSCDTGYLDTDGVSQPIPRVLRTNTFGEWSAEKQEAFARWWNLRHPSSECE